MGGKTGFVWDDRFLEYDFGPSHPLRPIRVKLTYELLQSTGILDHNDVSIVSPRLASEQELQLFHDRAYVKQVQSASEKGTGYLDLGDTPAFKHCYEVSSLIVGASLVACDKVMTDSMSHSFNPSGGLHHAHPERASGFCIFNDPAIVLAYLKSKYGLQRIVYLDIDAHHGDGVMYGYYSDPAVLDIDFHEDGKYLFPGTGYPDEIGQGKGESFKINIPLPPFSGDEIFLDAFEKLVPKLIKDYRPEIILVQCGADGHQDDRLAQLRLTTQTYSTVIGRIHDLAHELCNGRMLLYGGGGYTVANVPRVWTVAFASLAGIEIKDNIPSTWKHSFASNTLEPAPSKLFDEPTTDNPDNKRIVNETVNEVLSELKQR